MDKSAFQHAVREVVESVTTPCHTIYALLRAPREGNPQKAARIALENFAALKQTQERILTLRLDIEEEHRAARTRKNPEPAPFAYRLDVLADLQNTMLWALIGDDSAVTNLSASLDVDFGYLRDRNIESVTSAAREMNEDPRSFALIADLSTGVAIGDILHFTVTEEPRLSMGLLEIKEGGANRAVLDLHDLFDKDSAEFENAVRAFSQRYGEHGMKQLRRFVRQLEPTRGNRLDFTPSPLALRFFWVIDSPVSFGSRLELYTAVVDPFFLLNFPDTTDATPPA